MSQTLTALAEPTSPPTLAMRNALQAQMTTLQNLDRKQLYGIAILSFAYFANALGDTDYRSNFDALDRDASILFGGISVVGGNFLNNQALLVLAVLAWQAGFDVDATLSNDVNTLLNLSRGIAARSEEKLLQMYLFLQYMLIV